ATGRGRTSLGNDRHFTLLRFLNSPSGNAWTASAMGASMPLRGS
ncbi:MAG: hypothetical protein RL540_891, partial [Actinomycetota bacterium]